jgi:hypothetical protein
MSGSAISHHSIEEVNTRGKRGQSKAMYGKVRYTAERFVGLIIFDCVASAM